MKGETITVLTRTEGAADEMGEPTYTWTAHEVGNCLVRPLSGSDLTDAQRPDGIEAQYDIAFPKAYDGPALVHARIVLSDRVGAVADADEAAKTALRVTGSPDITVPCPTAWDMVVTAGVVYG